MLRADSPGSRDSLHAAAELQVHEHDVHSAAPCLFHRLFGSRHIGHHVQVVLTGEECAQACTYHRVVVGDQEANHGSPTRSNEAAMAVPPPGVDSTDRRPPSLSTRPRRPASPKDDTFVVTEGSNPLPLSTIS